MRRTEGTTVSYLTKKPFGIPLLFLLAMGNWGNTPSPPLDPNAPPPVGNDGELVLEGDGERTVYLVQTARMSKGTLRIEGEKVDGRAQFVMILDLTDALSDGQVLDTHAMRQTALTVRSSSHLVDPGGSERPISGGSIKVRHANGSGPWEVDGDVELSTGMGPLGGTLKARVRA